LEEILERLPMDNIQKSEKNTGARRERIKKKHKSPAEKDKAQFFNS